MQCVLYFVCPTDRLELIINNRFKQQNYYCTSLGNSMNFEEDVVQEICKLICSKNIREISFILSKDNVVIMDALGKQDCFWLTGLLNFYDNILEQKERSTESWKTLDEQFLILSYHLHSKIKELELLLKKRLPFKVRINGEIYDRNRKEFKKLHSELICLEEFSLN